jgi:YVTN family beta-propeller protein
MRRFFYAAAGTVLLATSAVKAADLPKLPAYTIVKTISLGAPDKWDFVTFDGSSNRVFVSHRTQVDVVDVATGMVVGKIDGIGESHGVAIVPSLGRGYADDAATRTLIVFDLKTLAKIAAPAVGVDADAVTYDPASGRVFVMNADGNSVSAVDAKTAAAIKTVPLGGAPESAAADGKGKLFINIASTDEIVAFDTKALTVLARWSVPTCTKPHGLAMDTATDRLFVSCVNARMLVIDTHGGKVLADLPIGMGTDDAEFDPKIKFAFSSNGEGTLSVIAEQGAEKFVSLGDVKTVPGARTMAVDPATGRIFLIAADVAGMSTPQTPGGRPHPTFVPGSVKLLILAPNPA